ncbi:MAG: hypothetical protein J6L89_07160 [Clostridia bacterium]|nr:hypothetical protein [Clostridia bacterium]
MKTIKKVLSILLVLATLFSISAASTLSASAAYYESESNDSYATANTLKPNSTITGIINGAKDTDVFIVKTSEDGKLTFTFNHQHASISTGWIVDIYCYSNGKYEELSTATIFSGDDEVINLPSIGAVISGVYYIKVTSIWTDVEKYDYSIKCTFKKSNYYEKEMNNSYGTATTIYANNEYGGYINGSNDVDVYKIIPSKEGKITPVFRHVSEESVQKTTWIVTIYQYADGKYKEISKNYPSLHVGESEKLPSFVVVANGVYYIEVDSIWTDTEKHEYGITAKSSTEPSVDIGTGENVGGNDDNITDPGFSFMDVLNAVLDFFKWLFSAVLSFFS